MLTLGHTAATSSGLLVTPPPTARRSASAAPGAESAHARSFADTMADVSSAVDGTDAEHSSKSSVPHAPASTSSNDAVQPGSSPGWAVASQAKEKGTGAGDREDDSKGSTDDAKHAAAGTTDLTTAAAALPTPAPVLGIPDPALGQNGGADTASAGDENGTDEGASSGGATTPQSDSSTSAPPSAGTTLPTAPSSSGGAVQASGTGASAPAIAKGFSNVPGAAQASAQAPEAESTPTAADPAGPPFDSTLNQIQDAALRAAGQAAVAAQAAKDGTAQAGGTGSPSDRPSLRALFAGDRAASAASDTPRPTAAGTTEAAIKALPPAHEASVSFGFEGGFTAPRAVSALAVGGTTFAATLAASTGADTLPAGTANQIVQAMRLQWANGAGEAHIQLQPDSFGAMTVSLRVESGQVFARVQADSPVVREWLQSNQSTLRQSMAEQNLTLNRLEVSEPPETRDGERRDGRQASDGQPQQRRQRRSAAAHDEFEVLA